MSYILLTGATGNLGAVILEQLMKSDQKVKAVVRSFAKSKETVATQYESASNSGQLTFTEIPDMAVPGAFDEALRNASSLIHVATPLEDHDFLETMIKPASVITKNILNSAAKSPTLKRVIITGSIVATLKLPDDVFSGRTISEEDWNSCSLEEAVTDESHAYGYSKVTSEKDAWEFMASEKPSFDLIYLLAPSIIGKSIQPGFKLTRQHLGGTSSVYKAAFDVEKPDFMFPYVMDVEDVAAIHIKALSPNVPGNERYLFHSKRPLLADEAVNFIREKYPELTVRVPAGSNDSSLAPNLFKTDISKASKVFGTDWKDWTLSVSSMVDDI
ncbi:NAD(P)-binding protein, partial [Microthyrium microscopicum]